MKRFINKLYNNQGGQLLISTFMAALCFAVLYLTHDVYWAMVDDNETMKIVSGYMTGSPVFCGPFINAFLGHFFSFLYGITTAVSWYTIFHIFVVFVSTVAIFWFSFMMFNRKNVSIIVPVVLCLLIFFVTFTYLTTYLLFTYSAVVIGCAAIAFTLIADFNCEKKIRYLYYSLGALCMLLCFVLRHQCGQSLICFWGLTIAYIAIKSLVKDRKKAIKKLIKAVCLVLVVFVVATVLRSASQNMKKDYETDNFSTHNTYRSKYMDYTSASWYTNKEFYESIGWTKDFFHMTKAWYFMDERFNLDTLKAINEETSSSGYGLSLKEKIFSAYDSAINDKTGLAHTITIISLFVGNLLFFALSKDKKKTFLTFLYALCSVGGLLLLSIYLCIEGRFLVHVYQTVALPTIVILFACLAMLWEKNIIKSLTNKLIKRGSFVVCSILCILLAAVAALSVYDAYVVKEPKLKSIVEYNADLSEYAAANKDSLFISHQGDVAAFLTYDSDTHRPNVILWGGCLYNSQNYYDFLKIHGYDKFYSENLYDDGVYFAAMPDFELEFFQNYLNETNGTTELVETYRTEHLVIYEINKI